MANDTTIMVRGRAGTTPRMMGERGDWTTFRLATSPRYRTRDGEWRDGPTTWLSVHVNGDLATHVVQTVRTGVGLLVRGRMSTDRYVGQDGREREQLRVVADSIGLDISQAGRVLWHPPQRPTDVTGLEVVEDEDGPSVSAGRGPSGDGGPEEARGLGSEADGGADDLDDDVDDIDDAELDEVGRDDAARDDAGRDNGPGSGGVTASPEILARAGLEPAF